MRIIATILLSLFMLQSSGATALAATQTNANVLSLQMEIASVVTPIVAAIETSQFGMTLMGQGERYAHMHAAPPVFPKSVGNRVRPPRTDSSRATQYAPRVRYGIEVPLPSGLPQHPSRDKSPQPMPTQLPKPRVAAGGTLAKRFSAQATTLAPPTTGINRGWTYAEKSLAGVGPALVNVANGNLLVQSDDVEISERGLNLTFRRFYNSQSQHDYAMTDGSSEPAQFGQGWTNSYDMHIAVNSGNTQYGAGLSVWDETGARWDYMPNGNRCLTAPAGDHDTLCYVGSGIYELEKLDGTAYQFFPANCSTAPNWGPAYAAYSGRLWRIYGRNNNNYIDFRYSWLNGDSTNPANLTSIVAHHSDGQALTMNFGPDPVSSSPVELLSIVRPDNQQITFSYDASGALRTVTQPGNNSYPTVVEKYWYTAGTHQMLWVGGPRYMAGSTDGGASSSDGDTYEFIYDANSTSGRLTRISDFGLMNFVPNDGTNSALQSGPTGINFSVPWYEEEFVYQSNSFTQLTDTQGHATRWYPNANGNVTETDAYTGETGTPWLVTQASWDTNNNTIATTDARGNTTNYQYDANGNITQVQLPTVNTSMGNVYPISRYVYDGNNNLTVYCDPNYNVNNSTCTAGIGTVHYTWTSASNDPNEPFGRLTDTYSATGYHQQISYDASLQGGADAGLPTRVQGDSFTQADGTTRTAAIQLTYNATGTLATYSNNIGTWNLAYDNMNRLAASTDPDNITSRTAYNADGTVSLTQAAAQYAMSGYSKVGTFYTYDADGNVVSKSDPAGAVTKNWYDGADRLVEVLQPVDATINPVSGGTTGTIDPTRYLYDLTQNGTQGSLSIDGASGFSAHGAMFATEMCFYVTGGASPCGWHTTKAAAYDALDRPTTKYSYSPSSDALVGSPLTAQQTTFVYDVGTDTGGDAGLLVSATDPQQTITKLHYNQLGQTTETDFTDQTPPQYATYDPDGRISSLTNAIATETYTYNRDGRVASKTESGSGITGAGTLQYDYYPDGKRQDIHLTNGPSSIANQTLAQYAYTNDGHRAWLKSNLAANPFTWTFRNSGRLLTHADPFTGSVTAAGTLVAQSVTYDAYGQASSITMPNGGVYANIAHDAEGEITNYTAQMPGIATQPSVSIGYDVRGEVNSQNVMNPYPTNTTTASLKLSTVYGLQGSGSFAGSSGLGVRTGARMSVGSYPCGTGSRPISIGFDPDGRAMNESAVCGTTTTTIDSRQYDAQNHTLSDNCPGYQPDLGGFAGGAGDYVGCYPASNAYKWGPNGRLASITFGTTTYSLHWDGRTLLYVTDSNGNLVQENVGQLATWTSTSNTLTVRDRDFSGAVVSQHQATAFDVWVAGPDILYNRWSGSNQPTAQFQGSGTAPFGDTINQAGAATRFMVSGEVLGMNHSDGYDDANLVFQGVRAYDQFTGQWTTPDVFMGHADNPISQRSYLWNAGNPLSNSDPSGYCTASVITSGVAGFLGGLGFGFGGAQAGAIAGTLISGGDPLGAPVGGAIVGGVMGSWGADTMGQIGYDGGAMMFCKQDVRQLHLKEYPLQALPVVPRGAPESDAFSGAGYYTGAGGIQANGTVVPTVWAFHWFADEGGPYRADRTSVSWAQSALEGSQGLGGDDDQLLGSLGFGGGSPDSQQHQALAPPM